jgi:hypothetical protein
MSILILNYRARLSFLQMAIFRTEYSQCLPSHWSHTRNILSVCHPIGHTHGIFSVSTIPLVTRTEFSHCLPPHWSHTRKFLSVCHLLWSHTRSILSVCHPFGHTHGIFALSAIPLVTHTEISQCLPSPWSHTRSILSVYHPFGHTHGIFFMSATPLVIRTEYSQCLLRISVHRELPLPPPDS